MSALSAKLRDSIDANSRKGLLYWCQGCESLHQVWVEGGEHGRNWGWNGDVNAPTFTPSVHVRTGRAVDPSYVPEPGDPPEVCHTFITNGQVQFLGDCTHALAGQTLPLPDLPDHLKGDR
jgi:hypothetical protein